MPYITQHIFRYYCSVSLYRIIVLSNIILIFTIYKRESHHHEENLKLIKKISNQHNCDQDSSSESRSHFDEIEGTNEYDTSKRTSKIPNLPIPKFYIYDHPDVNWLHNCTNSGRIKDLDYHYQNKPQSDDLHFLYHISIRDHPWRTFDITKADIFVIPVLIGFMLGQGDTETINPTSKCHGKSLIEMLETSADFMLKHPNFIKHQGKKHLIVVGNWKAKEWNFSSNVKNMLKNMTVGSMEIFDNFSYNGRFDSFTKKKHEVTSRERLWRCTVVVPYVSYSLAYPVSVSQKPYELIFRGTSTRDKMKNQDSFLNRDYDFFFMGKFEQARASYQTRARINNMFTVDSIRSTTFQNYKYIFAMKPDSGTRSGINGTCSINDCEEIKQCSNCKAYDGLFQNYRQLMINSKFALVIHGDTCSTSRLYDAIAAGAIPVILSDELYAQGLPFLRQVPWFDFAIFIPHRIDDLKEFADVIIKNTVMLSEEELEYKFERLKKFRADLNWRHPDSLVSDRIFEDAVSTCRL